MVLSSSISLLKTWCCPSFLRRLFMSFSLSLFHNLQLPLKPIQPLSTVIMLELRVKHHLMCACGCPTAAPLLIRLYRYVIRHVSINVAVPIRYQAGRPRAVLVFAVSRQTVTLLLYSCSSCRSCAGYVYVRGGGGLGDHLIMRGLIHKGLGALGIGDVSVEPLAGLRARVCALGVRS